MKNSTNFAKKPSLHPHFRLFYRLCEHLKSEYVRPSEAKAKFPFVILTLL